MKIYVKELRAVKELTGSNLGEIADLIDGAEELEFDSNNTRTMDLKKFNFWKQYIEELEENKANLAELADKLEIEYTELIDQIELGEDLSEHNRIIRDFIASK